MNKYPNLWEGAPKGKTHHFYRQAYRGCEEGYKRCSGCKKPTLATLEYFSPRKTASDGLTSQCKACQRAYFRKYNQSTTWKDFDRKRKAKLKLEKGYTVIEGHGMMQNGAVLTYMEVHGETTSLSFMDGTVLKRNKTGKLFEVWNKPRLTEIERSQPMGGTD